MTRTRSGGPRRVNRAAGAALFQEMLRSEPAGVPLHVIQRGHGRGACFFSTRDRLVFLHWLGACAKRFECALHAYVLMGNHLHLLVTPGCAGGATRLIQATCTRYERDCAGNSGRAGPLWESRFEATPVYAPRYVLACMCYIELNPVRASLEKSPGEYRWSSYRANALGEPDSLVTPHAFYYALGRSPAARQLAYRALFRGRVAAPHRATRRAPAAGQAERTPIPDPPAARSR